MRPLKKSSKNGVRDWKKKTQKHVLRILKPPISFLLLFLFLFVGYSFVSYRLHSLTYEQLHSVVNFNLTSESW